MVHQPLQWCYYWATTQNNIIHVDLQDITCFHWRVSRYIRDTKLKITELRRHLHKNADWLSHLFWEFWVKGALTDFLINKTFKPWRRSSNSDLPGTHPILILIYWSYLPNIVEVTTAVIPVLSWQKECIDFFKLW